MNSLKQTLISKLRRPIHITYIAQYLTKTTVEQTRLYLNELIEQGLVEESKYGKGYYVIKQK
jgi:spore cortex formation protein SpoVR/YcgB (stage V sporulation)